MSAPITGPGAVLAERGNDDATDDGPDDVGVGDDQQPEQAAADHADRKQPRLGADGPAEDTKAPAQHVPAGTGGQSVTLPP